MLTKKQVELIETIRNVKLATSVYLSQCLQCSKRSVINYVKEINSEYPDLIRSTKKGYFLDGSTFSKIAEEYHLNQQFSSDHRKKQIVVAFFLSNNDSINLNKICDELYISDSTIRSDLYNLKKEIKEDLTIAFNRSTASLKGKEKDKRTFYFGHIYRNMKDSFYSEDVFEEYFPHIHLEEVSKLISDKISSFDISINEHILLSVIVSIVISLARANKGFLLQEDEVKLPKFVRKHELDCAEDIVRLMEKKFNCNYSQTEILNCAIQLSSNNNEFSVREITLGNLKDYLWPSLYRLYIDILETLKSRYRIDISKNPSNAIGLALHLRNLIHRSSVDLFVDNPMRASIKSLYPSSYECAVYIARMIYNEFQIMITEDEITFLAIYVANNARIYQNVKSKISILFVIPDLNIISRELYTYYSDRFKEYSVTELQHQLDRKKLRDHDLIITTENPSLFSGNIPVLQINPFINHEDERIVYNKIIFLKNERKQKYVSSCLTSYMHRGLFFIQDQNTTVDDALTFLIEHLMKCGILSDNLKEDVLIRSRISSVTVNSVALLRPCLTSTSKNSLSFIRLKKPIYFSEDKIEALFLLTFNEQKFLDYLNVMEYMISILSDKNNAKKISKVSTFEELKKELYVLS